MKLRNPPKFQWAGFLFSMPFISWTLNSIMFGLGWYKQWQLWLGSFPLIFLLGMGSWFLHYQYDDAVRRKFPAINQTSKRVRYITFVFLFVMTPSVLAIFFLYDALNLFGYKLNYDHLKMGLLVGFVVNIVFETLWEVVYIVQKYKENLGENELLKQMSINQEFENMKSQVNPHFLFNCFNTLSSLISEDKKEAEKFLNELSKVYRYLLRTNEEGMATLESELKFMESYFNLLKTRHGDALQLHVEPDKKYNTYLVPSLSLQLLVENAVKHNVISRQNPLTIEIFTTTANQLVVNNNLQQKLRTEVSTGIGLKNIRMKYKLLGVDGFQVVKGQKNFMVVIPLIWNQSGLPVAKEN